MTEHRHVHMLWLNIVQVADLARMELLLAKNMSRIRDYSSRQGAKPDLSGCIFDGDSCQK